MLRILAGSLAGTGVLIAWGLVFWLLLPPEAGPKPLPQGSSLLQSLQSSLPASGSYYFPAPSLEEGLTGFREIRQAGPTGLLHFNRKGADPLSPLGLLLGLAVNFLSCLIAALLLRITLPALGSYLGRVGFVFLLGVFAAVAVRLADPVWWGLPWNFHLAGAAHLAGGWLLVGLVLGAAVRPARGYTHLTDPGKPLWKRALEVD